MLTNNPLLGTDKFESIIALSYYQTQSSKCKCFIYCYLNQHIQIYHSKPFFTSNLMTKLNTKLKKSLTKMHEIVILLNKKNTQISITFKNQKKICKIVKSSYVNTNNNLHYEF